MTTDWEYVAFETLTGAFKSYSLLLINIKGLKLRADPELEDAYYTKEVISSDRIKNLGILGSKPELRAFFMKKE